MNGESVNNTAKKQMQGQVTMFDLGGEEEKNVEDLKYNFVNIEEFDEKELLSMEKEMLGIYITGHPLAKYKEKINAISTINTIDMLKIKEENDLSQDGKQVKYVGIINSVKKKFTKKNTLMAFVTVFAIGACIFTCFFSVNETKDVVTTASKIHGAGSVIGFMLFLFVPLLIAILSFKNSKSVIGVISIICFVAALVFFALFVMSDKEEFSNTAIANEGLWQRLNLIFMYMPLFIVAVKGIIKE